ncbi:MAG: protein-L-isoaspartate(D-aspartate) O-methyltransferase [Fidelibacterota bacterium]|nr:MAG: protein-L-isoaspartate(D-aspartate) O-methyltransferase [Candidatus Neomarinimicrobiota bacterium]
MNRTIVLLALIVWPASWKSEAAPIRPPEQEEFARQRDAMVTRQIARRGVDDPGVLAAMRAIPRHRFVPTDEVRRAYNDSPLPIGYGQTISQPFIVAYMCQMARLDSTSRVLEVGTGSGYHASVMAQIADTVYTMEIVPQLADRARKTIASLRYNNIVTRMADGYYGWPDAAPFDAIVVTAAPEHIPPPLVQQLAEGGRMVIPVGHPFLTQYLVLVEKRDGRVRSQQLMPVRFVPFTGGH